MNLPNKITLTRMISIPFIAFFYLADFIPGGWGKITAFILFVITGVTDFLDGYIARKYNLVTDFGKFLDPIADKIHMCTGLLLVVADKTILAPYGVIMAIVIIAREFIVSALRQIAVTKNVVLAADMLGKIKANFQSIGIGVFMFLAINTNRPFLGGAAPVIAIVGYVLMGLATIFTIWSAVNYIVKNRQVLSEETKKEEK